MSFVSMNNDVVSFEASKDTYDANDFFCKVVEFSLPKKFAENRTIYAFANVVRPKVQMNMDFVLRSLEHNEMIKKIVITNRFLK